MVLASQTCVPEMGWWPADNFIFQLKDAGTIGPYAGGNTVSSGVVQFTVKTQSHQKPSPQRLPSLQEAAPM